MFTNVNGSYSDMQQEAEKLLTEISIIANISVGVCLNKMAEISTVWSTHQIQKLRSRLLAGKDWPTSVDELSEYEVPDFKQIEESECQAFNQMLYGDGRVVVPCGSVLEPRRHPRMIQTALAAIESISAFTKAECWDGYLDSGLRHPSGPVSKNSHLEVVSTYGTRGMANWLRIRDVQKRSPRWLDCRRNKREALQVSFNRSGKRGK